MNKTKLHFGNPINNKQVERIYMKNNNNVNLVKKIHTKSGNLILPIYDINPAQYNINDLSWEVLYSDQDHMSTVRTRSYYAASPLSKDCLLIVALMHRSEVSINDEESYNFHLESNAIPSSDGSWYQKISVWSKRMYTDDIINIKVTQGIERTGLLMQIIALYNANTVITVDNELMSTRSSNPTEKHRNCPRIYMLSSTRASENPHAIALSPNGLDIKRSDSDVRFSVFIDETSENKVPTFSYAYSDSEYYANTIHLISLDII